MRDLLTHVHFDPVEARRILNISLKTRANNGQVAAERYLVIWYRRNSPNEIPGKPARKRGFRTAA